MKILQILLIATGLIISSILFYFTNLNQTASVDTTFQLIELQTQLGFPIWLSGLLLMVIGFVLPKSKESQSPSGLQTGSDSVAPKFQAPEPESLDGGVLSEGVVDESMFMQDWMVHVQAEARNILLPSGAQVVHAPTEGVQLGLLLTRTTPQATKQALTAFAEMLHKIPTPPRVRIELMDVMATGVPIKNITQGAFTRHFAKQDFIITEQIDGLDIRFNHPDDCWKN